MVKVADFEQAVLPLLLLRLLPTHQALLRHLAVHRHVSRWLLIRMVTVLDLRMAARARSRPAQRPPQRLLRF